MFHLSLSAKRKKAYTEKDWKRVISTALQQLKTDPHDIKALNDLAVAYYEQQMLDQALQTCQKINELYPGKDLFRQSLDLGVRYMRYHLILGQIQYTKGQHEEALKIFDRLKAVKGAFSDKYHYSALIHAARGQYDLAVQEYRKMWETRPERADKVLRGVEDLIKRAPIHQGANRLQFEIHRKQGTLQQIVQELEITVKRSPEPVAVCRLAYASWFEGDHERAQTLLRRYVEAHPAASEIHWVLGELSAEGGDIEQALLYYREAVRLNPAKQGESRERLQHLLARVQTAGGKAATRAELFTLSLRAGDFQASRQHLESLRPAVTEQPALKQRIEETLRTTADRSLETGDLDAAKAVLEQLLLVNPGNQECRARLEELEGLVVERKLHEYETRLETGRLSPQETTRVMSELATVYLKQGRSDEKALSLYQQVARSTSPLQADAQLSVGLIFMRKGLVDLAEREFEALLRVPLPAEKQKDCLYQIARAFEETQRPERAQEAYKRILSIDAAYKDVVQRLGRIAGQAAAVSPAVGPSRPPGLPEDAVRDRYEQLTEIGAGGMGRVVRAVDRMLKRPVVLKFINEEMRGDPEAVSRFIREAQATSALMHPGIVTIYDIHVKEPLFIAMEYIDGGSLRDRIKQGPVPVEQVGSLAVAICDALAFAHRAGVVHRDIKPDNIMLTRAGGIKITDFGLAWLAEGASRVTRTGQILGTPAYMAPEQILGKPVDARTDVYALGVVLYELLTGELPFSGGDLAYRQVHERPVPPAVINPKISQWLDAIIMTALQKRPEDRYHDMDALKRDLALQQEKR